MKKYCECGRRAIALRKKAGRHSGYKQRDKHELCERCWLALNKKPRTA